MVFTLRNNYDNKSGLEFNNVGYFWSRTASENKSDLKVLNDFTSGLKENSKALTEADINTLKLSERNKNLALNAVRNNTKLKDQKVALQGVTQGLQKTSITSKLAATGMRLLATAGNMVAGLAIGAVLNLFIQGIDALAHSTENAKERTEELFNEYNESMESVKSANEFIADKETLQNFVELSKGVNSVGENISLTTSEFDKYHEIANKIAELFPDMVKNWDDQGNAIIKNKENLQAYIDALKEENKLKTQEANQEILEEDKVKDTWKAYKDEVIPEMNDSRVYDIDEEWGVQLGIIKAMIYAYKQYKQEVKEPLSFEEIVKNKNGEINFLTGYVRQAIKNGSKEFDDLLGSDLEESILDSRIQELAINMDAVGDLAGNTYQGLITYQSTLNSKIDQSTQNVQKLGKAYLQNNASFNGKNYWDLDEDKQNLVLSFANNINASFMKGITTTEQYYQRLDDFANAVANLTPDQMKDYTSVIDITTKFNNGEVSYDTWKKQVDAFLNLFKDEDTKKTFKIAFDVDETNSNYNRALEMFSGVDGGGNTSKNHFTKTGDVKGSVSGEDIIGKLTGNELSLWMSDNIQKQWKQWASKHQNASAKEVSDYIKKIIKKAGQEVQNDTSLNALFGTGKNSVLKAVKVLDQAYKDLNENKKVSFSTLSDIRDNFVDAFVDDKGKKQLDSYINQLAAAQGNTKKTKQLMSELTQSYILNKIGAENLATANKDVVEALLEECGVSNKAEVAAKLIAQAKIEAARNSGDFTNKTRNEISTLLKQAGATDAARRYLALFDYQKKIAGKHSLDTTKDVNELKNLAKAAGVATIQLDAYKEALANKVEKPKAEDYPNSINAYEYALKEYNKSQKKIKKQKKKAQEEAKTLSIDIDSLFTGDSAKDPNGKGSGSYSPDEDKWLDKREKELEKLKHKHEMGAITEEKYYQEVNKIYKKFAPKIKSKKAQIAKIRQQIRNVNTSSDKGKKKKEKLQKDLEQAKKELDEIQKKSNELIESVHENKVKKIKEDYTDWQEIYLNNYLDGKIKSLKGLKKKIKKWLREHAKVVDKDAYKELLKELPDWLDDAQEKKFERVNNKLDTAHDFDLKNDKDFYNEKVQTARKFYKQNDDFKDEYIDSIKSLYDYCKDQYKEDIENQKESLEEQKEILEDKKDAIQDFYDKQIELLENADELDQYYSDQAEKRKTVNDLKAQINQLQRDKDSAIAQKRIKELQSDLKDAEKELADFEKDRALQETIAMLQEQCNNELKTIENQIDSIDESIKSLDKTLRDADKINSATYDIIRQFAIKKGISYELPTAEEIKGWYASGTSSSVGGLAVTQENGAEAVGINLGNGRFTYLTPDSKVISASASKLLYEFANNPRSVLNDLLQNTNKNANAVVQNVANDNTQNIVNVSIQVQGNADENLMNKAGNKLAYQVLEAFKKLK